MARRTVLALLAAALIAAGLVAPAVAADPTYSPWRQVGLDFSASPATDVSAMYAVGDQVFALSGNLSPEVQHCGPASCVRQPLALWPDEVYGLADSIAGLSADDVWAAGQGDLASSQGGSYARPAVWHFNGVRWSRASTAGLPRNLDVFGVAVTPDGQVWASGARITGTASPDPSVVYRRTTAGTWLEVSPRGAAVFPAPCRDWALRQYSELTVYGDAPVLSLLCGAQQVPVLLTERAGAWVRIDAGLPAGGFDVPVVLSGSLVIESNVAPYGFWRLDGDQWTPFPTTGLPAGLPDYAAGGDRMVALDGYYGINPPTWWLDGATWTVRRIRLSPDRSGLDELAVSDTGRVWVTGQASGDAGPLPAPVLYTSR